MRAVIGLGPVLKNRYEPPGADIFFNVLFHVPADAPTGAYDGERQVGGIADEGAGDLLAYFLTVFLIIPRQKVSARNGPVANALVALQFARMFRFAVSAPVVRSCDGQGAQRRSDADGDHVLLDILPKSDTGIEARCYDICQAVIDIDLYDDFRVLFEKIQRKEVIKR